jgi:hypothetical protein
MRRFLGAPGSVSRIVVQSVALNSTMLGDPSARAVDVYVPAGCDGKGLPLVVDLVGFTSSGLSHTNWTAFRENLPERLDRLIGEQLMPPVVVPVSGLLHSARRQPIRQLRVHGRMRTSC